MRSLLIFCAVVCASCHLRVPFGHHDASTRRVTHQGMNKAGAFFKDITCRLDDRITIDTIPGYITTIKEHLWATACGLNRGVFTLFLPEYAGFTYSCGNFPPSWGFPAENWPDHWFSNPSLYADHLKYLDLYIQGVYNTSIVRGPAACDLNGLARLHCGSEREEPFKTAPWAAQLNHTPIRGVNIGGWFVLEPWITPGFTKWDQEVRDQYTYSQKHPSGTPEADHLRDHWRTWYTASDFHTMAAAGLNSIRLPVGWWYFASAAGISPAGYLVPTESIGDSNHPITVGIRYAHEAGLKVFLDMHGLPLSQNGLDNSGRKSEERNEELWGENWFYSDAAQEDSRKILLAAAQYIDSLSGMGLSGAVVALELVNEPWVYGDMSVVKRFYDSAIPVVRGVLPSLPIVVSDAFRHEPWSWLLNDWGEYKSSVALDSHIYHAFNLENIASSTPECDKLKMVVNENTACGYGGMLRYKTCTSLPTMVGEWSLALEDCMGYLRGSDDDGSFIDVGQCKHLVQRVGDPWWREHYQGFGRKQRARSERELGWFFWTWKVDAAGNQDPSAAYWSFELARQAGYFESPLVGQSTACDYPTPIEGQC